MPSEALLSLQHLTKRFGGVIANDAVSLDVAPGEIHALIGPNGAGKTTLLGLISGELRVDLGRVIFAGTDITAWPAFRRARSGLARSFQITSILPSLTARENVALAAAIPSGGARHPWRPALARHHSAAHDALERCGLATAIDTVAAHLSHGERRQLELAMAIATRPRLLLLDEPTAGMGAEDSQRVTGLIRSLARDATILLVEHDMALVFAVADRISVLAAGAVIATGVPAEIRDNPAVRRAYLGEDD